MDFSTVECLEDTCQFLRTEIRSQFVNDDDVQKSSSETEQH